MKKEKERIRWKCKRCGKCCKFIVVPVKEPVDMETEAYLEAHGIIYTVSMTSNGFEGKIIIPAVCKYLDVQNGTPVIYRCKIHETKFANCRLAGKKECKEAQKAWSLLNPKS
jgi:Fe-S-cluster containining protein